MVILHNSVLVYGLSVRGIDHASVYVDGSLMIGGFSTQWNTVSIPYTAQTLTVTVKSSHGDGKLYVRSPMFDTSMDLYKQDWRCFDAGNGMAEPPAADTTQWPAAHSEDGWVWTGSHSLNQTVHCTARRMEVDWSGWAIVVLSANWDYEERVGRTAMIETAALLAVSDFVLFTSKNEFCKRLSFKTLTQNCNFHFSVKLKSEFMPAYYAKQKTCRDSIKKCLCSFI